MIAIFFVPGTFGSMIEYSIRCHSLEYSDQKTVLVDVQNDGKRSVILDDGSVHSYKKMNHFGCKKTALQQIQNITTDSILTPIYPFSDLHLNDVLSIYQDILLQSRNVLVYIKDLRDAELNMLFQYHKIAFGRRARLGLSIFCGDNSKNIVQWNPDYTHWSEMQRWELREWLSLFYPSWTQEWIESIDQVDVSWLTVTSADLLYQTVSTMDRIMQHCRLTKQGDLESFLIRWRSKQQYVIDRFSNLERIVRCTTEQIEYSWNELDIISETIIQQRLREKRFEIRCDGLNTFPTDSKSLYNLLEAC